MPTIIDRETDLRFWAQTGYKPGQKLDPKDPKDAAMFPVWIDIQAKVKDELGTSDKSILDKETNARFWAQTGYKPGQKLDPKDPKDAEMAKVWLDVFGKVKAEAAGGKLVLTYNHPVVAQNLSDAQVADRAAGAHLDVAASQPQVAPQNIAGASTAANVSAQKVREAAQLQPPTVSPKLAQAASKKVAEQVARVEQVAAKKVDPQAAVAKETNARFWDQTGYKRGQRLDPKNPQDVRMMPAWMRVLGQVQQEHLRQELARRVPTGRDQLAQEQARGAGTWARAVHRHHRRHPQPIRTTVRPGTLGAYRASAARWATAAAASARVPHVIVLQRADGALTQQVFSSRGALDEAYVRLSEQPEQYRYVAAFDLAVNPRDPVHDSVGVPAAEHADVPAAEVSTAPPAVPPSPPGLPEGIPPEQALVPVEPPPPAKERWFSGKVIAIVAAAVAGVTGLAYVASRRRTPRSPKVFVASPMVSSPARPLSRRGGVPSDA